VYSVRYEGYGPGDCAVMVDCVTGDPERTASAVREAFLRHGGRPGAGGSVAYLFKEVGRLLYPPSAGLGSQPGVVWEAGAEEVEVGRDGSVEVLTDPVEIDTVRSKLALSGHVAAATDVTYRSSARVVLGAQDAARLAGLVRALETLDGVRSIYTNAENAGELLASV
jgi:transcriptional/translational regulatory protein YebC/TACO1